MGSLRGCVLQLNTWELLACFSTAGVGNFFYPEEPRRVLVPEEWAGQMVQETNLPMRGVSFRG